MNGPKYEITVTRKLPRITIKVSRHATKPPDISLVIPGFSRSTLHLAHAITAEFLFVLSDRDWSGLQWDPRIDAGDKRKTCTELAISLSAPARPRWDTYIEALRGAAERVITLPTGGATYDVSVIDD